MMMLVRPSSARLSVAFLLLFVLCAPVFAGETIQWTIKSETPFAPIDASPLAYAGTLQFVGSGQDEDPCIAGTDHFGYDPHENDWYDLEPIPECRGVVGASWVAARKKKYLFGGIRAVGGPYSRYVQKYSSGNDSWYENYADIPYEAGGFALAPAVAYHGDIFVFGGIGFTEGQAVFHDESFRFDISEREFFERAPMPSNRFAMHCGNGGAYLVGEEIWLVGGFDENEELLPIDVYDPEENVWREPRATPPFRGFTAMAYGKIYLFKQDLSQIRQYDAMHDTWNPIPVGFNAPSEFNRIGAVTFSNGRFYVLGGRHGVMQSSWLLEGELIEAPGDDVRTHISPGESVIYTTQKLNVAFGVEGPGIDEVEWIRVVVNGIDHTHGFHERGVHGTIVGGGVTLRFPANPRSLVRRLGPGVHTIEFEVEVGEERYSAETVWRFVENVE